MPAKKGQMFILTMTFLIAMFFTVQTLLFRYSEADFTSPIQNVDAYMIDNIEDAFQSALNSSQDCETARNNVITLRNTIGGGIRSGREISITGDINCTGGGGWSASPPELTIQVMIVSGGGETWATLDFNRS